MSTSPNQPPASEGPDSLIAAHAGYIGSIVRDEAGVALLRFDSADDLAQGAREAALRAAAGLEWRGDDAFRGWLATIVRRHLSARRDYWFACKRNPSALLRLTRSGAGGPGSSPRDPADSQPGPATFAQRREQLVLVTRAVALLPPRDRELVELAGQGVALTEIAARLALNEDAAERARTRALERLRKAFVLVSRAHAAQQGDAPRVPRVGAESDAGHQK